MLFSRTPWMRTTSLTRTCAAAGTASAPRSRAPGIAKRARATIPTLEEVQPVEEAKQDARTLGLREDAMALHLDLGVGDLAGEDRIVRRDVLGPYHAAQGDDLRLVVDDHRAAALEDHVAVVEHLDHARGNLPGHALAAVDIALALVVRLALEGQAQVLLGSLAGGLVGAQQSLHDRLEGDRGKRVEHRRELGDGGDAGGLLLG